MVLISKVKRLYYMRRSMKSHVLHIYDEPAYAPTVPRVVNAGFAIQDMHVGPIVDALFV